jgi:methionyl-tRNA formyltransferase
MAGDAVTGVQVMKMEAGLDTGPVMKTATTPIREEDTTGDVQDRLALLGAGLMVEALAELEAGPVRLIEQAADGVTHAAKVSTGEARIDWTKPATEVAAHIRGLSPFPGAWFELPETQGAQRIKALHARAEAGDGEPGLVLDEALLVACGSGAVRITRLQRAGKGPMLADDFQRGSAVAKGWRLS